LIQDEVIQSVYISLVGDFKKKSKGLYFTLFENKSTVAWMIKTKKVLE
jgi:hypothetical protein